MASTSLLALPQWQKSNMGSYCCPEFQGYIPPRCAHNAVCVNEELLVWGGYNDEIYVLYCPHNVIWLFNIEHDCWYCINTKGQRPSARTGAVSVLLWPYWYIIGGNTYDGDNCDTFRLNLLTLLWEVIKCEPCPPYLSRDKAAAWTWKERIYVFGGYGAYTHNQFLWNREEDHFVPENFFGWNDQLLYLDTEAKEWIRPECIGEKPSARAAHSTTRVGSVVYLFGGRHRSQRLNDLYRFDLETNVWSGRLECQGQLPCGRSWHTMTKFNATDLFLFGGFSHSNLPLDDAWILKTETLSWCLVVKSTGFPRLWHTACINSVGDILVFGGCMSNIVEDSTKMVTSRKIIIFRRKPFDLVRLCLHAAFKNRHLTKSQWNQLPQVFQDWLKEKTRIENTIRPSMDADAHVLLGHGPPLSALAIS